MDAFVDIDIDLAGLDTGFDHDFHTATNENGFYETLELLNNTFSKTDTIVENFDITEPLHTVTVAVPDPSPYGTVGYGHLVEIGTGDYLAMGAFLGFFDRAFESATGEASAWELQFVQLNPEAFAFFEILQDLSTAFMSNGVPVVDFDTYDGKVYFRLPDSWRVTDNNGDTVTGVPLGDGTVLYSDANIDGDGWPDNYYSDQAGIWVNGEFFLFQRPRV